jgi:serine/threonine protein kinase
MTECAFDSTYYSAITRIHPNQGQRDPRPLAPGTAFDRYVIEHVLGEGGMGTVYAARDLSLGRRVALKVPRADGLAGAGAREQLWREARACASLSHPNAAIIYEVGDCDGYPFIAMEHLEGRTLRSFIGDTCVDVETRLRWLVDVARLLAVAHAADLIHLDIKPENIIVTADGIVKVFDFGLARVLSACADGSLGASRVDTDGIGGPMVGTVFYMAPEQMIGESVDDRTDQFAWGVTAYELLSGSRPWRTDHFGRNAGAREISQILSDRVAPELQGRAVPARARATIAKALAKNRTHRFTRMIDLVDALVASE